MKMLTPLLSFAALLCSHLLAFCFSAPAIAAEPDGEGKKIVFLAGPASHGYGEHEHFAGCQLLASALRKSLPKAEVLVNRNGWPTDDSLLDGASTIIMYCDGGQGHMANKHLERLNQLSAQGAGIVCIHYGVETTKGENGAAFLNWIGGYFEPHYSVNPHWEADYTSLPDHPICRGVKPFKTNDEWYYHMRFRDGMKGVTPILTALPPKQTLSRPDGPHSGNPEVRAAIERGEPQHMAWASEREGAGRGFGFTGGHFHWNWAHDDFRKLVLNAIAWTAHIEVPEHGIESDSPSQEQLEENQDEPKPTAPAGK